MSFKQNKEELKGEMMQARYNIKKKKNNNKKTLPSKNESKQNIKILKKHRKYGVEFEFANYS